MTIAIPDPRTWADVVNLAARLLTHELPPPAERAAIRDASGASIEEVAAALGVSPMTIRRWENGTSRPWPRHKTAYMTLLAALEQVVAERRRGSPAPEPSRQPLVSALQT